MSTTKDVFIKANDDDVAEFVAFLVAALLFASALTLIVTCLVAKCKYDRGQNVTFAAFYFNCLWCKCSDNRDNGNGSGIQQRNLNFDPLPPIVEEDEESIILT